MIRSRPEGISLKTFCSPVKEPHQPGTQPSFQWRQKQYCQLVPGRRAGSPLELWVCVGFRLDVDVEQSNTFILTWVEKKRATTSFLFYLQAGILWKWQGNLHCFSPTLQKKREMASPAFTMVDLGAAKKNETLVLNLCLSCLSVLDEVIWTVWHLHFSNCFLTCPVVPGSDSSFFYSPACSDNREVWIPWNCFCIEITFFKINCCKTAIELLLYSPLFV